MAAKPLSEKQAQAFVGAVKSDVRQPLSKLGDGGGLFLAVAPQGGKPVWRLKYRLGGKEQLYTLGAYPALGLAATRQERDRLRQQILDKPINLTVVRGP